MAGKLIPKIAAGCLTLVVIGCLSALIGSADTLSDYEKKQKELTGKIDSYNRKKLLLHSIALSDRKRYCKTGGVSGGFA